MIDRKWEDLPEYLDYKQVAVLLEISDKSVSQFLTKHRDIKRGHLTRRGRRVGVVERDSLMVVVDKLNYIGLIQEDQIIWAN